MDKTVTISKKSILGDVVIVPRREYEEFSFWKKAIRVNLEEKWFWTKEWQKKEAEADEAINSGRVSKEFSNHKELISALKSKKK